MSLCPDPAERATVRRHGHSVALVRSNRWLHGDLDGATADVLRGRAAGLAPCGTSGTRLGPQEGRIMGQRLLRQHATRDVVLLA
jgi:hypothetical protein